ncbi:hypothetical protein DAI18_13360 [Microvirgula aerodenitrificans]|uniref:Uncharacterized protein n=1 Tax=Microvirgula aerodenitrificans TaxID=57480 RepID=A0A2S0PC06_9NEIS|nr:hypothetical protein DAI18_13360 [Microvirgula aerodenitrificans]
MASAMKGTATARRASADRNGTTSAAGVPYRAWYRDDTAAFSDDAMPVFSIACWPIPCKSAKVMTHPSDGDASDRRMFIACAINGGRMA